MLITTTTAARSGDCRPRAPLIAVECVGVRLERVGANQEDHDAKDIQEIFEDVVTDYNRGMSEEFVCMDDVVRMPDAFEGGNDDYLWLANSIVLARCALQSHDGSYHCGNGDVCADPGVIVVHGVYWSA